jgi:hypothetical protein
MLYDDDLQLVSCYHYWYKQAAFCSHENRLQGYIADTGCTSFKTQPVDILLVSGNLFPPKSRKTRVNDSKKYLSEFLLV